MRKRGLWGGLVFFIFSGIGVPAVHAVKLVYNPDEGRRVNFRLITVSTMVTNKFEALTRGKVLFSRTTIKKTEEKIKEVIVLEKVQFEGEMKNRIIKLPLVRALQGKKIEVEFSPQGEILKIEGLEQLGTPGIRVEKLYFTYGPAFPEKEVKKGDQWVHKATSTIPIWNSLVNTEIEAIYTVRGFKREGKKRYIIIEADLKTRTITRVIRKEDEFTAEVTINGEGRETIIYDYLNSELVQAQVEMKFNGEVSTIYYGEKEKLPMALYLTTTWEKIEQIKE